MARKYFTLVVLVLFFSLGAIAQRTDDNSGDQSQPQSQDETVCFPTPCGDSGDLNSAVNDLMANVGILGIYAPGSTWPSGTSDGGDSGNATNNDSSGNTGENASPGKSFWAPDPLLVGLSAQGGEGWMSDPGLAKAASKTGVITGAAMGGLAFGGGGGVLWLQRAATGWYAAEKYLEEDDNLLGAVNESFQRTFATTMNNLSYLQNLANVIGARTVTYANAVATHVDIWSNNMRGIQTAQDIIDNPNTNAALRAQAQIELQNCQVNCERYGEALREFVLTSGWKNGWRPPQ
jgi:hypothetical protein